MFCPVCGAQLIEGEEYCRYCGSSIEDLELDKHAEMGSDDANLSKNDDSTSENAEITNDETKNEDQEEPFWAMRGWGDERFLDALSQIEVADAEPNEFIGSTDAFETIHPLPSRHRGDSGEIPLEKLAGVATPFFAVALVLILLIAHPFLRALDGRVDDQPPVIVIPDNDEADGEPAEGEPAEGEAEGEPTEAEAEAAEPEVEEKVGEGGIVIRAGLWEYSWEELKSIAGLIEKCENKKDAIKIAQEYNLADSTGIVRSDFKEVVITEDNSFYVRLVDVWHDDASTPSKKAGLTFISTRTVSSGKMSSTELAVGGWEKSSIREWLLNDLYEQFPPDLRDAIIPVNKLANNTGKADTAECVTATEDLLWIPSIVELTGKVAWEYEENPKSKDLCNSVYNAEGSQYEAYHQQHVTPNSNNSELAVTDYGWWTRSTDPATGQSQWVTREGKVGEACNGSDKHGIVFGFCL